MNIVFVSNAITPHQIPVCDELSKLENVSVKFIESINIDKNTLPIGWQTSCRRDYVVSFDFLSRNREAIIEEIFAADVVIYGSGDYSLLKRRLAADSLTFLYSERIYKKWKDLLKVPIHFLKFSQMYGKYQNLYLLCASAFAAKDYGLLSLFRKKSYKWGYFTSVENEVANSTCRFTSPLKMLWCSRFIDWKHPELAVKLAQRLKTAGYSFQLDMIGEGEMLNCMKTYVMVNGLGDCVNFLGTMPNKQVHEQMRKHDIFLFTSDKGEGWGAVANEAMSNGCVLIASDEIGSVPYLVVNQNNGVMFKSKDINSLYSVVKDIFDKPKMCMALSNNAIRTIKQVWSPKNAAESLVRLSNDLLNDKACSIQYGPCSKA